MIRRCLAAYYRCLLLAYPAAFRRDLGRDAATLFADTCLEALHHRDHRGVTARLVRAAVEVPAGGLATRLRAMAGCTDGLTNDVRFGMRGLLRRPAFTLGIWISMSLGVALCTAMFTAINAVLLRPWPVEHARELVRLGSAVPLTMEDLPLLDRSTTLVDVAATHFGFFGATSTRDGDHRAAYGRFVSPGFFETTGVRFALGRGFLPREDQPGTAAAVVVISHAFWQQRFGGSADVIGQTLTIGKTPYAVIGVTREGWRGQQPYRDDVWLPSEWLETRRRCCYEFVGRLATGHTREAAAAELSVLAGRTVTASGTSMLDRMPGHIRAAVLPAVVLLTSVVLLITGANVAHMQLARAMTRTREIRTRLALGASRGRIVRQLLAEAVLVTVAAAGTALVVVHALLDTMMAVAEFGARDVWVPDLSVYAYCLAVSLAMSVGFSVLPAWRLTRARLTHSASAAPPERLRYSLALLSAQVALSIALLSAGALLTRALTHATRGDAGFAVDGLVAVSYGRSAASAETPGSARAFREAIDAAVRQVPDTALVGRLPFSGARPWIEVRRAGDPETAALALDPVPLSSTAFQVMGIDLVQGRAHSDDPAATEAVLNLSAAARLWPGQSALGKAFSTGGLTYTVVGVTKDVHYTTRERITPTVHLAPAMTAYPTIIARGDLATVGPQVSVALKALDARVTVHTATVPDLIAERLGDELAGASAARVAGVLAVCLAGFGIIGVFGYLVEQRRREIGIRIALGARVSQVFGAVFRPARIAMCVGVVAGFALSLSLGAVLEGLLFGLSPFDGGAFTVVTAVVIVCGGIATAIPAHRALHVNPIEILKDEN